MKSRNLLLFLVLFALVGGTGYTYFKGERTGEQVVSAAEKFVATLDAKQRETVLLPYASPTRLDWHFIPKDERKGLQIKHMSEPQRKAALDLLRATLSQVGYDKATAIMELEKVLNHLEQGKGRWARDHERYYYTLFGKPGAEGRWGLSIEGHHLSLNFVIDGGEVISSTPQFFATNPAVVHETYIPEVKKGTRVLKVEEVAAFKLVNSLDEQQAKQAVLADKAPAEIRGAGDPQPPVAAAEGIAASDLNEQQAMLLKKLIREYIIAMPVEIAAQRSEAVEKAGFDKVHFAWAGAKKPGVGHYYRIQGPTFLIELVNTQPDAAGNPANHIHCVWRDMNGDFALPVSGE